MIQRDAASYIPSESSELQPQLHSRTAGSLSEQNFRVQPLITKQVALQCAPTMSLQNHTFSATKPQVVRGRSTTSGPSSRCASFTVLLTERRHGRAAANSWEGSLSLGTEHIHIVATKVCLHCAELLQQSTFTILASTATTWVW